MTGTGITLSGIVIGLLNGRVCLRLTTRQGAKPVSPELPLTMLGPSIRRTVASNAARVSEAGVS